MEVRTLKRCRICGFKHINRNLFSWHHLIPKSEFWKLDYIPHGKDNRIMVCISCHARVHFLFMNWELGESYNTIGNLKKGLRKRINEDSFMELLTDRQLVAGGFA